MYKFSQLKQAGKGYFKANYWISVLTPVVMALLTFALTSIGNLFFVLSIVVTLLVTYPLAVGLAKFLLNNREGKGEISDLFFSYNDGKEHFGNIILVEFIKNLFIFLWSLLLVIPGIIKTFQYAMVDYILAENPDIDYKDALELSKNMMHGHKFRYFLLNLSFFGWFILGSLTCFILDIFYVIPYYNQTMAEFYVAVRDIYYYNNGKPGFIKNGPSFNNPNGGAKFDPQTGMPIADFTVMDNAPKFDPETGNPLTDMPVENNVPKFDPQTGMPLTNSTQTVDTASETFDTVTETIGQTQKLDESENTGFGELHSETKADSFEFSNPFNTQDAPKAPDVPNPFDGQ